MNRIHRRTFLRRAAAGTAAVLAPSVAAAPAEPPKVAVVFTEFTHRSHAHVFLENFLEPYLFNGQLTQPASASSASTPTSTPTRT
jgi:hypothetical protein